MDGWSCVSGYTGSAAARTLSRIPVLFRDQRTRAKIQKCDYTRITMVVKRCGFYAIRRARPDHSFPPQRVGPQRRRQRVAGSHGFTFHACPPTLHRRRSPTSRAPPTASGHGQQKRPVATTGADITAAPTDCTCVRCGPCNRDQRRTAAFNRTLLTNEY